MMKDEIMELVLEAVTRLKNKVKTKTEIDRQWAEVKGILLKEMNRLPDIPSSTMKKQNRKFKKSKPFWNKELEILWSNCCKAEKVYLRFKVQNS